MPQHQTQVVQLICGNSDHIYEIKFVIIYGYILIIEYLTIKLKHYYMQVLFKFLYIIKLILPKLYNNYGDSIAPYVIGIASSIELKLHGMLT
jgi:hypothetical protein